MLSVIVLTKNEARNIQACLESVKEFADELIVFDSISEDQTVEIARRAGAEVYQHEFENFALQRNAAIEVARGEWVFFIDADERADERLGQQICATIAGVSAEGPPVLGCIPRKNIIFGKWIKHTGWSPDYQPRLLRKGAALFDTTRGVHELVNPGTPAVYLSEPLVHLNYDSLTQFRAKQDAYSRLEAEDLFREGARFQWRSLLSQPVREFYRRFVKLDGFKDGAHGLLLSGLMAYYTYVRQRILLGLERAAVQNSG